MKLNHLFEVQVSYVGCIVGLVAWDEMSHPGEAISHHKKWNPCPFESVGGQG